MAFMTELLVDEYGYLLGGEDVFPLDVTMHDWRTPYPQFDSTASFDWATGTRGDRPNVFRHPEVRDWVCDDAAWSVLSAVAPSDVRLLGQGRLGEDRMYVVQVVAILNVVDRDSLNVRNYGSYEVVEFPTFHNGVEGEIWSRIFRIPGSYTDIFVGGAVKGLLEDAGIVGLAFTPAPYAG